MDISLRDDRATWRGDDDEALAQEAHWRAPTPSQLQTLQYPLPPFFSGNLLLELSTPVSLIFPETPFEMFAVLSVRRLYLTLEQVDELLCVQLVCSNGCLTVSELKPTRAFLATCGGTQGSKYPDPDGVRLLTEAEVQPCAVIICAPSA